MSYGKLPDGSGDVLLGSDGKKLTTVDYFDIRYSTSKSGLRTIVDGRIRVREDCEKLDSFDLELQGKELYLVLPDGQRVNFLFAEVVEEGIEFTIK